MNRGFFKTWIIVIALVIIAGGTLAWQTRWAQKEETANWKTYYRPEVNFTFKIPPNWEIKIEYQYKSAACQHDSKCNGVRYIFLNKTTDTRTANLGEKEKFGIAINMPQCNGVRRSDLPGNNWVCVFDKSPEVLNTYEQIRKSFQLIKDKVADWKTYRNEEYGFEVKYPSHFYPEENHPYPPHKYGTIFSVGFGDEYWKKQALHLPAVYITVIKATLSPLQWLEEYGTPINTWFVDGGPLLRDYLYLGVTDVATTRINNIPVVQFRHAGASGSNQSTLFKKEPDVLYKIDAHSCANGNLVDEIYIPMLSSFRFIGEAEEIKTGKIKIDYKEIKRIQKSVDEGHQPWRLNPIMVVRGEFVQYGFSEEDLDTLVVPDAATQDRFIKKACFDIMHKGKVYVITLIQPIPGKGKFWTISEIKLKTVSERA